MTALLDELRRIIASEGPITVERYMSLCLGHPRHGYYTTRDPLGAAGDFITAPEISQMFGELIGLWALELWQAIGAPRPLRLIELGPGRGTLMADLLRVARLRPAFLEAAQVVLVETSPALRERQRMTLQGAAAPVRWAARFAEAPAGPAIIVANEFFDALPVRQLLRTELGWCERLVGVGEDSGLAFGLAAEPDPAFGSAGRLGDVLEWPAAGLAVMDEIAHRVTMQGGAALVIDYGHEGPAFGDTLQAVKRHAYADLLAEPGAADLTAQVDFGKLAAAAKRRGAAVHGPVSQGDFLRALGVEARAARLKASATPEQARDIDAALIRLTTGGATGMGELFKVLCIAHPALAGIPGFVPASPVPAETSL